MRESANRNVATPDYFHNLRLKTDPTPKAMNTALVELCRTYMFRVLSATSSSETVLAYEGQSLRRKGRHLPVGLRLHGLHGLHGLHRFHWLHGLHRFNSDALVRFFKLQ